MIFQTPPFLPRTQVTPQPGLQMPPVPPIPPGKKGPPPWLQKFAGGVNRIFDGLGPPPSPYLGGQEQQAAQQRQRMAMAASLLQNAGPRPVGTSSPFGAIGGAIQAGQESQDQFSAEALRQRLAQAQMNPQPSPTDDQREYQQAVSQGFQGSFLDYLMAVKKAGAQTTNINTGSIPPGYEVEYDDQGRPKSMRPIAGSPAATAIADAEESEQQSKQDLATAAQSALSNPDLPKAFGFIQGGLPPMTQGAVDARADVNQVVALLSLENREKMKGTGQISDYESRLLGQSATVLQDPRISDERARQELEKISSIVSGGPIRITSADDYLSLPSGTEFIDPNGVLRRKP